MRRCTPLGVALIGALVLSLAGGLARAPRAYYPPLSETYYVFGTLVEIVLHDTPPETAHAATAEVAHLLRDLHRDWHAWRPGALTDLNAALAAGERARVPPGLAKVLVAGRRLSCESDGLFEPAMGALVALWGFHADTPPAGGMPDPVRLTALRAAAPRMADLWVSETYVESRNRAVQLDLGGYAKGAALDMAAEVLTRHGITNAVLNAGGDVQVLGANGGAVSPRPWRIAIRDPFGWGALAALDLAPGEALYTSGNYERFFEAEGTRFAHILDPRTGAPVQGVVSASALHSNGMRADAAATALSVAGIEGWAQTAADMDIAEALIVTEDGRILATPAMAHRLRPPPGTALPHLTVTPLPQARRMALCDNVGFATPPAQTAVARTLLDPTHRLP